MEWATEDVGNLACIYGMVGVDHLPVNGEAVDEDRMSFLGCCLAEAFEQD